METILKAKVSTGKKDFRLALDKDNDILIVEATKLPDKNKANKEIIKEIKKILGAETTIVSGFTSKEKLIKINLPKKSIEEMLRN
jgi:uncharacterized protein (TIGR00251 family)